MDHGRFDYSLITERPRLVLPHGAQIAVFVAPNFEHFHYDKPAISIAPTTASFSPDIMNYSWRDYGARVGVWRMMEVMDRHGIPGTVALNSEVCLHYPQIIKAGNELDWEWMGHGTTNSMFHTGIDIDDERQIIATAIDTIGAHTGTKPKGWLGPGLTETHNTLDLLAEAGIEYVADWVNDDQPYRMNVKSGRMFAIPYSLEINYLTAFMFQGRSAVWANDQGPIRRPLSRKRDDFAGHVDLRPPLVDWAPLSQQIFRRGARLYQRSRRRVVRTRSGNH